MRPNAEQPGVVLDRWSEVCSLATVIVVASIIVPYENRDRVDDMPIDEIAANAELAGSNIVALSRWLAEESPRCAESGKEEPAISLAISKEGVDSATKLLRWAALQGTGLTEMGQNLLADELEATLLSSQKPKADDGPS